MPDGAGPEPPEPMEPDAVFDPLEERVRAWWTAVLTGEPGQDHPVYGGQISARLDGEQLEVTGVVPTSDDRDRISREAGFLVGRGVDRLVNDVAVKPPELGEEGVLAQVIVSVFDNVSLALLAQQYLQEYPELGLRWLWVEGLETNGCRPEPLDVQADRLVRAAVDEGRAVLVTSVDELKAFHARTLLDEETRSLQTFVLPPYVPAPSPSPDDDGSSE